MRRRVRASISFVRINCLSAVFMVVFLSVCLKSVDFEETNKVRTLFSFREKISQLCGAAGRGNGLC